ncbi:hypothetical protein ACFY7H_12930 [Streptomyces sp. NPDC012794]|uniref:hypothetical protein n=1 Tax=Streptomyces sp. NPDC012794 TaxID=3364850 RepID=UPI0036D080B8
MPISYTDQEIHDRAAFLGYISPSQELPRNLRSRIVANLMARDAPEASIEPSQPQMAREIVIQPGGVVLVDGEPFPWLLTRQAMEVYLDPDGISTVRLTLMADAVRIIQPEPRPESE